MTMSRWKLTAGAIAASVGGLILAGGARGAKAELPREAPRNTQSTSQKPPTDDRPSVMSFELMVPMATPMPEPLPAVDPVSPSVPALPVPAPVVPDKLELPSLELPRPELPPATLPAPPVPVLPLPAVSPGRIEMTFPPETTAIRPANFESGPESTPMPRTVAPQQSPLARELVVPPVPTAPQAIEPPTVKTLAPPVLTPPLTPPNFTPAEPEPSKLKMTMRLGDGNPRFEIRNQSGEVLLLKVYAERISVQQQGDTHKHSLRGVTAEDKVRFSGPGVEGTCDMISVISGTGEVLMKGNIQMRTKVGRNWSEMTADKVVYQIGASGLRSIPRPAPTSTRTTETSE